MHNLLEMSRLQSGQTKINFEWHVLEEVVGCALAQLEAQLPEPPGGHSFARRPSPGAHRRAAHGAGLHQPAGKCHQIYPGADAGGRFPVGSTNRNSCWKWRTGARAWSPGDEELVFEKFYQAGSGSARGVGLGLTICRSIIEAHRGRIWAANRPGGGATFRFTLPLEEGRAFTGQDSARDGEGPLDESARSVN